MRRLLISLVVVVAWAASAQTVTKVQGKELTLSVGANQGMKVGMEGRACTTETVGGQSLESCPAAFVLSVVGPTSSRAVVTRGNEADVRIGFAARFKGPPPATPVKGTGSKGTSADKEDLFWSSIKDSRSADDFADYLSRFPTGTYAGIARRRMAELSGKAPGAAGPKPAATLSTETPKEAQASSPLSRGAAKTEKKGTGKQYTEPRSNVTFAPIPKGKFTMGCTEGDTECDPDEKPAHRVTIARGYYLAETPTTNEQYKKCVDAGSCQRSADIGKADHPVVNVDWNDAKQFCEWAGGRLPTEAEWEYAARGGRNDWRYPWGNEISHDVANYLGTGGKDQWVGTSPVKSFPANGYGLYDMAGNVWQWVADWNGAYSGGSVTNPKEPSKGSGHVYRGGSWADATLHLRVSRRFSIKPGFRIIYFGFRCVRDANSP